MRYYILGYIVSADLDVEVDYQVRHIKRRKLMVHGFRISYHHIIEWIMVFFFFFSPKG